MRIRYKPDEQWPTPREVAPGLLVHVPGKGVIEDFELGGQRYEVEIAIDQTSDGVRPISVKVTAMDGSPPISRTTLRQVPVWELAKRVILLAVSKGGVTYDPELNVMHAQESPLALSDEDVERALACSLPRPSRQGACPPL